MYLDPTTIICVLVLLPFLLHPIVSFSYVIYACKIQLTGHCEQGSTSGHYVDCQLLQDVELRCTHGHSVLQMRKDNLDVGECNNTFH